MDRIRTTPPAGRTTLSRRLLVVMGALLVGARLAPPVAADRVPANGRSIADRVRDQEESCLLVEGDFSSRKTAFGSVITTCSGGKKSANLCQHRAKHDLSPAVDPAARQYPPTADHRR